MLTRTEKKKQYFNRYWQTRDLGSADLRSRQRAEVILSLLDAPGEGMLIDVGCGRGLVMSFLAERGYTISGCDVASDAVTALRSGGFEAFLIDIEDDPMPGKYDGILCLEVLQQLFDPAAALAKLKTALNENGYLIVSVPNEFHIVSRLRFLLGKNRLGHFDESHLRLFTPRRARELFERAGLAIETTIPVPVVPPRWKGAAWLASLLAGISPALFSLSQVYRLKVR